MVSDRLGDGTIDRRLRQTFPSKGVGRIASRIIARRYSTQDPGNDPVAGHPSVEARDPPEDSS